MQKQMSLFIWAVAVFGMAPVWAATNSGMNGASVADFSGEPSVRTRVNVDYEKYETRTSTKTYESQDARNIYYTKPSDRSQLYKQYSANRSGNQTVRTTRAETYRTELKRKYYLAHPFFQPLKGKFASATDISYYNDSYNFKMQPAGSTDFYPNADWKTKQLLVQETVSVGLTDTIALTAGGQYSANKYKMKFDGLDNATSDSSDLNSINIGAQWRVLDTDRGIATLSGYYNYARGDFRADVFALDFRAGYKVASSTVYGVGRGWYYSYDGDFYGNYMAGENDYGPSSLVLVQGTHADSIIYAEGGIGVFTVMDEDWTLNAEALYGYYDWHNMLSLKAAIGWQPNDWFGLNLYAKTSVYDSANGSKYDYFMDGIDSSLNAAHEEGTYKIEDKSELSFGVQAFLYF